MRVAQSSHLQAYEYSQDSQLLTIQFVNGAVYQYYGVPFTEYWNLAQSGSPGEYFSSKIKGSYQTVRVADGAAKRRR